MKTQINAIIVEDEPHNLELLVQLIEEYCPSVIIQNTAHSVKEAISKIQGNLPDILFLDIELPDGNGFEVLENLPNRNFSTIFITGYDKYAVKAIKYAAYDYLLKPLSIDELQTVIKKYKEDKLNEDSSNNKIFITDHDRYRIIDCMNVFYLETQDNYTYIHLGDQKVLSSYSIGKFENSLPEYMFRCHRSFIVNVHYIQSVSRGAGGEIKMKNGRSIPVAYRRKSTLLETLKKYT